MGKLEVQLKAYVQQGLYPMHMPGHKRRLSPGEDLPCSWDLTEVDGVDDLHQPEGILKEAMERTAALHGASRTWYLVNGSTCGLLAGIRALAPEGSHILIARNCHKAVYHAIELGNLQVHYLIPSVLPQIGVYGSIKPEDVETALQGCPKIRCVVVTSPTYEGVLSNIRAIARICHRHGARLLVDEAHGAHLGLFPGWPDSALHQGADLVVQSAHKTLPSLTQTALLHLGRDSRVDPEAVSRQLDIFETSSPSYPLMASLDGCTQLLSEQGRQLFSRWEENLQAFDRAVSSLQHLEVLGHGLTFSSQDFYGFDPGKIPVCTGKTDYTGPSLAHLLRTRFHFETEMACGRLTLAMTGMADPPEAVERFSHALITLDRDCTPAAPTQTDVVTVPGKRHLTSAEAVRRPSRPIPTSCASGQISAEYIWAYPPGVPLTVPGEQINPELLDCLQGLAASGTRLYHSLCRENGKIQVLF